jgi:hypothetical protein
MASDRGFDWIRPTRCIHQAIDDAERVSNDLGLGPTLEGRLVGRLRTGGRAHGFADGVAQVPEEDAPLSGQDAGGR